MRNRELTPTERYVENLYGAEDPGLAAIRRRLTENGRWGVNIGANEGRLLQFLVRISGARRILEIGALYGYSTVWLARALPEGGRLISLERDPECVRMARVALDECGVSDRAEIREGEASATLRTLSGQAPFDFVFIDANKSAYPAYLDWAESALPAGGLIVADNIFLGGAVVGDAKPDSISMSQWNGMREFNARLADPRKFRSAIVPTTEGLSVAIKI